MDEFGFLAICPRCNLVGLKPSQLIPQHEFDDCPNGTTTDQNVFYYVLICRDGKPPIKTKLDITKMHGFGKPRCQPLTPGYALQCKADGVFNEFMYKRRREEEECPKDLYWSNKEQVHLTERFMHPQFLPRVQDEGHDVSTLKEVVDQSAKVEESSSLHLNGALTVEAEATKLVEVTTLMETENVMEESVKNGPTEAHSQGASSQPSDKAFTIKTEATKPAKEEVAIIPTNKTSAEKSAAAVPISSENESIPTPRAKQSRCANPPRHHESHPSGRVRENHHPARTHSSLQEDQIYGFGEVIHLGQGRLKLFIKPLRDLFAGEDWSSVTGGSKAGGSVKSGGSISVIKYQTQTDLTSNPVNHGPGDVGTVSGGIKFKAKPLRGLFGDGNGGNIGDASLEDRLREWTTREWENSEPEEGMKSGLRGEDDAMDIDEGSKVKLQEDGSQDEDLIDLLDHV